MKKALILASLCAVVVFSSCGSKKGKWSDADKKKFSETCLAAAKAAKADDAMGKKVCDCALPKAEAAADNAAAFALDKAANDAFTAECMK